MKMNKLAQAVALVGAGVGLAACGSSSQDSGGTDPNILAAAKLSGTVVDGYVARALVYVDTNRDGVLDSWEPRAMTDNDGNIGVGADGTNYCADTATAEQQDFCLRATNLEKGSKILVRTEGGYDVLTGEPFSGSMGMETTVDGEVIAFISTPLTTLLAYLAEDEVQHLIDAIEAGRELGLTEMDLRSDFFKDIGTNLDDARRELIRTALQVHKVVDAVAVNLRARYQQMNAEVPADLTPRVYQQFAQEWRASGYPTFDADGFFSADNRPITAIIGALNAALATEYGTALADMTGVDTNAGEMARAVDFADAADEAELKKRARAVEVVAMKVRKNKPAEEVVNAVALSRSQGYRDKLNDHSDLSEVESTVAAGTTEGDIPNYDANRALPSLAGKMLSVRTQNEDKADLYFGQDGALTLCVDYQGDSVSRESMRFEGSWSRLGDYRVLMNATIVNSRQALMLKSLEKTDTSWRFGYDYGDEGMEEWSTTPDAFQEATTVPATSSACFQ